MSPVFTASSPGRLDVMGGFADYSGSLVLQMPIANQTTVNLSLRNDFQCTVKSEVNGKTIQATIDLSELKNLPNFNYPEVRTYLARNEQDHWATYVVGCAIVLMNEKQIDFRGADFFIQSNVPLGKGVSSSAALEVATMKALTQAFNVRFSGTELPILAQRVENLIVGAPCGLMDQLASYFGRPGQLLPITCQPDILHHPIDIPKDIHFIGIDSGVRHSVSGSSYTDVRCAAFMGYTIIAESLGATTKDLAQAKQSGQWQALPLGGYLSGLVPDSFEITFRKILPEKMSGKEFLERYHTTIDRVTSVQSEVTYNILNCTEHPVYENNRVQKFRTILEEMNQNSVTEKLLQSLGSLMKASHDTYTKCGLGSSRTDEIVELAHHAKGIYGAKITGGGSGGTVCLLAVGDVGVESAKKIHREMEKRYSTKLELF
jgi:galactokinase